MSGEPRSLAIPPRTRLHSCPNCTCKPACDVCGDMGTVSRFEETAVWTGPQGDRQSSAVWTSGPCPKGCPRPMVYL